MSERSDISKYGATHLLSFCTLCTLLSPAVGELTPGARAQEPRANPEDASGNTSESAKPDTYASLDALKANERVGVDYKIEKVERKSGAVIVSPHGGFIESGTSELAHAIAGDDYSLFDFEALQSKNSWRLHVTATHFIDPDLNSMLADNLICVTLHGRRGRDEIAWLGGLNEELKNSIATNLKASGVDSTINLSRLAGVSTKNMVNRTKLKGVQIELPSALRDDPEKRSAIAGAVRKSLYEYLKVQK